MRPRWHVNSYTQGRRMDSTAFPTRTAAVNGKRREDEFETLLVKDAGSAQEEYAEKLRAFVMDEDDCWDYDGGQVGLEPVPPLVTRYERRVEPCRTHNCVACYEAGLIELTAEPEQDLSLLAAQAWKAGEA